MGGGHRDCGMPLGNLTSQFFANVYLNELDYYIKNVLQAKYYIRYVDDFVILSNSIEELQSYHDLTDSFLKTILKIELHPEKTKILNLEQGIGFLGLRIFYHYKLLKKSNLRKFRNKINNLSDQYDDKLVDYDTIHDSIEGWAAYSKTADTYNLRLELFNRLMYRFSQEISTKEYHRHLREDMRPNKS